MTPSEIETAARRMLNAAGDKLWSSAEIIENYLYFAAMEMASETFCIQNRYSTTTVADQQEYAVPTRMLAIKRLTYDSQKLKPISLQKLDSIDLNTNTTVTGEPQYYYHFDDAFGLYPAPSTAGKTIKVFSFDEPSVPSSTSTLEIPSRFHPYLVIGVAYYMSLKELGHPHTNKLEWQWNSSNNRHNAIDKVRRSVRMMNKDNFNIVINENDQPSTYLGMI
jgi:hypothetical protein